jgi:hypothetical protein
MHQHTVFINSRALAVVFLSTYIFINIISGRHLLLRLTIEVRVTHTHSDTVIHPNVNNSKAMTELYQPLVSQETVRHVRHVSIHYTLRYMSHRGTQGFTSKLISRKQQHHQHLGLTGDWATIKGSHQLVQPHSL